MAVTLYEKIISEEYGFDIRDKTYDMMVYIEFDHDDIEKDDYDKAISMICKMLNVPDDLKQGDIAVVDLVSIYDNNPMIQYFIDSNFDFDWENEEDKKEIIICSIFPQIISGAVPDRIYTELANEVFNEEEDINKYNRNDLQSDKTKNKEYYCSKIIIPSCINRELNNVIEMYEENLENDILDTFYGTQDSYANEMLSQDIYNVFSRENVEKIMSLNNNLDILLELDFSNKAYDEIVYEITDKLSEKFEDNIQQLEDFVEVIQEEELEEEL